MTQKQRLLNALKAGPLTPMECWNQLGIYRVSGRILELRQDGHDIKTEMVDVENQFGEPCRVARYSLNPKLTLDAPSASVRSEEAP